MSCANLHILDRVLIGTKSLMNTANKKGAMTEPCGTGDVASIHEDLLLR